MPDGLTIWYAILTSTSSFLVSKWWRSRRWGNRAKKDRDLCKFIRLPATTNFHRTRMRPPNPLWRLFISSAPDLSSNLRSREHTERFLSLPPATISRHIYIYVLIFRRLSPPRVDSSWYFLGGRFVGIFLDEDDCLEWNGTIGGLVI